MTTQHTPGPWEFSRDSGWYIRAPGESLMGNDTYYPWNPENVADWQLIAAAPELLEALKALVQADPASKFFCEPGSPMGMAYAAIYKATGVTK